ncbi:MAG: hypothetical protein KAX65_13205 [Caldilineaceae bacterium]|nr:hypothetical protein [Caldilineaceae bacterium]
MADQPAFSRCPYCQRKLEKRPQRKSKCPLCGETIYVRGDDLMRDDEVEAAARPKQKPAAASKKSTKKSTGAAKPAKSTAKKKKTSKPKTKPKSKLESDLKRKKKAAFKPGDLQAGIMLVIQLLGKFLKPEQIAAILGGLMGGGNATRSAFVDVDTDSLLTEAAQVYDDLDADDQRQLLAVFTWAQSGFSLDEDSATA